MWTKKTKESNKKIMLNKTEIARLTNMHLIIGGVAFEPTHTQVTHPDTFPMINPKH
jgi:hypothetical protein